jgi:hypothetical protein
MGRTGRLILMGASSVLIIGCGGTALLTRTPARRSRTTASSQDREAQTAAYLARLTGEQSKLAAAERGIPTRAQTPAALSRAISLLASAIRRLAQGLVTIRPPRAVARAHARLVAIVRAYAARLTAAARAASAPGGELRAATMLISATTLTSRAFTDTVATIYRTVR